VGQPALLAAHRPPRYAALEETKTALCGLNGNTVTFKCKYLKWDRLGTQMTAGKTKGVTRKQ
jgi:hypothetical protein